MRAKQDAGMSSLFSYLHDPFNRPVTLWGCVADLAVKPRRRRTVPRPSQSSSGLAGVRRRASGDER
jgi:hypothetical protein